MLEYGIANRGLPGQIATVITPNAGINWFLANNADVFLLQLDHTIAITGFVIANGYIGQEITITIVQDLVTLAAVPTGFINLKIAGGFKPTKSLGAVDVVHAFWEPTLQIWLGSQWANCK